MSHLIHDKDIENCFFSFIESIGPESSIKELQRLKEEYDQNALSNDEANEINSAIDTLCFEIEDKIEEYRKHYRDLKNHNILILEEEEKTIDLIKKIREIDFEKLNYCKFLEKKPTWRTTKKEAQPNNKARTNFNRSLIKDISSEIKETKSTVTEIIENNVIKPFPNQMKKIKEIEKHMKPLAEINDNYLEGERTTEYKIKEGMESLYLYARIEYKKYQTAVKNYESKIKELNKSNKIEKAEEEIRSRRNETFCPALFLGRVLPEKSQLALIRILNPGF